MTNRMKAILGASATIAVWATAFPFGKVALQSVDALTLSVARVVGGAILMLIIGVFKGLHIPTSWREWGLYILLGATGNFVYQVVFNEGLRTIPAATSSIIMALTPMTTALMALVVYKDKIRPRRRCTCLKHMLIVKTKNDIVPERSKAYKTKLLSL